MIIRRAIPMLVLLPSLLGSFAFAAVADSSSVNLGKEGAVGYAFVANRSEIIAKAKKEGTLRAVVNMRPANIKASAEAFRKKYPFINFHIVETTGTEAAHRLFLEVSSNRAREWDVINVANEFWSQYLPYFLKIDILGTAQRGVLQIPPIIDAINRNILPSPTGSLLPCTIGTWFPRASSLRRGTIF